MPAELLTALLEVYTEYEQQRVEAASLRASPYNRFATLWTGSMESDLDKLLSDPRHFQEFHDHVGVHVNVFNALHSLLADPLSRYATARRDTRTLLVLFLRYMCKGETLISIHRSGHGLRQVTEAVHTVAAIVLATMIEPFVEKLDFEDAAVQCTPPVNLRRARRQPHCPRA